MMRTVSIIAGLLLPVALGAPRVAASQDLSPTERAIAQAVDHNLPGAVRLLEQAVLINSGTMNFAGVRSVGDLFADQLQAIGLRTEWVEGTAFHRAGHLVARLEGSGRCVLLIGHLDTVFEADSPFRTFAVEGSLARGPGTIDMKGGDVIIVEALRALWTAGVLDGSCITVVMTGDEEKAGSPIDSARYALVEAARTADVALGFEDGDGNPATAVVARRGASRWLLRVEGTPAHSSQIFQPEYGSGAIFEAARILTAFHDELSTWPDLTFNPGVIVGGTDADFDVEQARGDAFGKNNVIAGATVVSGDLRATSPSQLADAEARMRAIVAEHLPGTQADIEFVHSYPPMAASEGNLALLELYDLVSRDLGLGPVGAVNPRNAGAADVSFAAAHVDMALDGLGLMGTAGHTDDETADMNSLPTQTKRAAILLYRLLTTDP